MKCVCGYSRIKKFGVGDEEFLKMEEHTQLSEDGFDLLHIYFYCCPKCGTVKAVVEKQMV